MWQQLISCHMFFSTAMITKPVTVMEYLEYFLATLKRMSKANMGITETTFTTYRTRARHLRNFIVIHNMQYCLPIDISVHFFREYEIYLLLDCNLSNNWGMRCIHVLDNVIDLALENREIPSNPARLFKYRFVHKDNIVYCEPEDLDKIRRLELNTDHDLTRDYFIFGCCTGLAFSDIRNFNYNRDTFIGPDNRKWIRLKRKKTGNDSLIPLLPEAIEILARHNYKIPSKSNQKVNRGLKIIGERAELTQILTSHVARKTFGHIMHNIHNISIEIVSIMLGHKSIKTTQSWYVKTNVKKLSHDMKSVQFMLEPKKIPLLLSEPCKQVPLTWRPTAA